MKVCIDKRWGVRAEDVVEIGMPASAVWGQMKDFRRFLTLDPLHAEVVVTRDRPAPQCAPRSPAGAKLLIRHRFLGVEVDRVGRMLRWREGQGFAMSDLSRRGTRVGFPHVCVYAIEPDGPSRCRLRVAAVGRWTATSWPRWLVRLWMCWVLAGTRERVRREMHAVEWARRRLGPRP
ncbi:MAG: hypothetical protein ACKVZJ_01125 [Phycisphaerales bacterium]